MKSGLVLFAVVVMLGCSPSRDERVQEMKQLQVQSRTDETLYPLWELFLEFPHDAEINSLYGIALLDAEASAHAIWPLRVAAEAPEASIEDYVRLGQALRASGAVNEALEVAREVISIERGNVDGLILHGTLAVELRQWEELLDSSTRLIELGPSQRLTAYVWKAKSLAGLNRFSEAYEVLDQGGQAFERYSNAADIKATFCHEAAKIGVDQANLGIEEAGAIAAAQAAAQAEDSVETETDPVVDEADTERAYGKWESCLEEAPGDLAVLQGAVRFFDSQNERGRSEAALKRFVGFRPYEIEGRFMLADHLAGEHRYDEAEQLLREATELEGVSAAAWFMYAQYFRDREDYAAAVAAFEKGVAGLDERQQSAITTLAFAQYADDCVQSGQFEKAELAIEVLDRPEYVSLLKGRIALLRGDPEKAIEELKSGLLYFQGNSGARYLLGQAAEQLGDVDGAIEEYRDAFRSGVLLSDSAFALARLYEAEGSYGPLMHIMNVRSGRDPQDPRTNKELARIATMAGAVSMARSAIERLASEPGQEGAAAAAAARLEFVLDGPESALKAVEDMGLDLSLPASEDALAALVRNLIQLERHDEALSRIDQALEAYPEFAPFHRLRAMALLRSGPGTDGEEEASLERSVALDPNYPSGLRALAEFRTRSGDTDEAIELYDRATAADTEDPQLSSWSAIQLLRGSERDSEVDRRLEDLVVLDVTHSGAAALLAERLLEAKSDLKRADELARRAVRFRGSPIAWETAGLIALELEQVARSVQLLRRAVQLRPESPSARYRLARALIADGRLPAARKALEFALSKEGFPEAGEARDELVKLEALEKGNE